MKFCTFPDVPSNMPTLYKHEVSLMRLKLVNITNLSKSEVGFGPMCILGYLEGS